MWRDDSTLRLHCGVIDESLGDRRTDYNVVASFLTCLHLLGLIRGGTGSLICTPLITRGSNHVVGLAIASRLGTLVIAITSS